MNAIQRLGELIRLFEARVVDYMEPGRPAGQGPPKLWIAKTLDIDPISVRVQLDGPDDHLADQAAMVFEQLLRDAGNKIVGLSGTGPVAKLTAEVMVKAGWVGTKIRSGRRRAIVPDQETSG